MSVKRALVVDDSKSASAFLVRLLERLDVDVDVAESAEEALDYLELQHPDVIFLDHLMPGMDGFQGLQAIKRNPRTAVIPVFMYTSQEGELYAGQAVALGAAGVLPKQLEQADLARLLRGLEVEPLATPASLLAQAVPAPRPVPSAPPVPRMTAQAPEPEIPVFPLDPPVAPRRALSQVVTPVAAAVAPAPAPAPSLPSAAAIADIAALRAEVVELRRFVSTGLEEQSRRLVAEVAQVVGQAQPAAVEPAVPSRDWRGTLYGLLATVAAIALAVLWLRGEVDRRSLEMQVAQLSASRTALVPEAASASPAEAKAGAADAAHGGIASPLVVPVPYGEPPLAGSRVERLQDLLGQLSAAGFQGVVEVQTFTGRFCLKGSVAEGYTLAPDATPVARCDFAAAPGSEPAQRESPQFSAMVADFRKAHGDAITLSVTSGPADPLLRPYPETGLGVATAADWNASAAQNSRIEVRWRSRS